MSTCHCVDVAMGSYDNQVSMLAPFDQVHRDDRWVCIDTCIATEIGRLWHLGVKTLNSCCGHGKVRAWVIVAAGSYDLMDRLGYEWEPAPSGLRSYLLTAERDVLAAKVAAAIHAACPGCGVASQCAYERAADIARAALTETEKP